MTYNSFYRGRALSIAIGIIMLGLLFAGGAGAATLTVCSSSCTYSSIQAAINAASSGDIIIVNSDTYYENVNVNKQLTLRGIGMPVVNAGGSGSAINLQVNGIILEGFTATAGDTGITVGSNSNKLSRNNASNNYYYGIYLSSSSYNTLSDNIALSNGDGISLQSSGYNTLSGNNASKNSGYGIHIMESSNNNIMSSNNASNDNYGISLASSSNNMLRGNNASNNLYGIILESSRNSTLIGNIANSNLYDGFQMYASRNNTLIGNIANSNDRYGFHLNSFINNLLTNNTANTNKDYGIMIFESTGNTIYNNYFNNINNFGFEGRIYGNNWNNIKMSGTNIVGGSYLGGNFWGNPEGTGFSQTCINTDGDGICDSPYVLDANNTDFLPLDSIILPNTNSTTVLTIGKPVVIQDIEFVKKSTAENTKKEKKTKKAHTKPKK